MFHTHISTMVTPLSTIADLKTHLVPGDVLYLDIDETLVSPENDASEPWAVGFKDALVDAGVEVQTSWTVAVQLWQALQCTCTVVPPEGATTQRVLLDLKAAGYTMIGLTARGPEMAKDTLAQLTRCGLGGLFDETRSFGELQSPPDVPMSTAPHSPPLAHANGIVFCSGSRKPQGLLAYEAAAIEAAAMAPSSAAARPQPLPQPRVVLVDDRQAHCQAVGDALSARGRAYLGLHYTHTAPHRMTAGAVPGASAAETVGVSRGWALLATALAAGPEARSRVASALSTLESSAELSTTPGTTPGWSRLRLWMPSSPLVAGVLSTARSSRLWMLSSPLVAGVLSTARSSSVGRPTGSAATAGTACALAFALGLLVGRATAKTVR